jgi:hypothetical protein
MLSNQDHAAAMFVYVGYVCFGFSLFGLKEFFFLVVFIAEVVINT